MVWVEGREEAEGSAEGRGKSTGESPLVSGGGGRGARKRGRRGKVKRGGFCLLPLSHLLSPSLLLSLILTLSRFYFGVSFSLVFCRDGKLLLLA